MGGMENRPFDYIWMIDGADQEASAFIDGYKDNSLRLICDKTKRFLRGYYSNYSLELLSTVDYLLENVQSLKNWRNDDVDNVLDVLALEIQKWSKRKEKMFKRCLLKEAVIYLRDNMQ